MVGLMLVPIFNGENGSLICPALWAVYTYYFVSVSLSDLRACRNRFLNLRTCRRAFKVSKMLNALSSSGLVYAPTWDGGWVLAFNFAGGCILLCWSGMLSFFLYGSLAACGRLARNEEGQAEGSNGCMREDLRENLC
jgi:hypothetical protein